MLSDALRAAALEAEELEKNQTTKRLYFIAMMLEFVSYGIEIKR